MVRFLTLWSLRGSVMPLAAVLSLAACVVFDTGEHVAYGLVGRKPHQRAAWIALGVGLHVIALLVWLWLLTLMPLGRALPLRGGGYITIALAGRLLFNEWVGMAAWAGIALIVVGVALICQP